MISLAMPAWIRQQEPALPDDHFLVRRQQVHRVGLDGHVVLRLPDAHRRAAREQFVHQALEIGREVLKDDERHAGVGRQMCEEPLE